MRAIWLGHDQGFSALNEALIALLPKKDGASDLKDFRPISLVHSFARLLTKVLARRLGPRMVELVGANQTAFIRGRCIQDNYLLVKESAKLLHRRKVSALLLKVDIAKAFDSISRSFLLSVLRQRGFGPRWLGWITLLLRTATTSVLVNGCAGDALRHGRGLRQGDPISPLLFVIAMDVLSALFLSAERAGILSSLADVGLRHRVSLYADDVVIFSKPCAGEIAAVWEVLACFGGVSGLKANPAKSFAASIRKAELHAVLDKLAAKLPFWKARLLSREGRLTYVQAVLSSSVVYHLLALDLDPWFVKAVDKLRRGFLWAGAEDAKGGCCVVAWHLVCQPKSLGGLGLRNLTLMNTALRSRWMWLQRTSMDKPWAGLPIAASGNTVSLFNASVCIKVGPGSTVLFWEDAWIGGLAVDSIAPAVLELVKPAVRRTRTVQQGKLNNAWAQDISGQLSVDAVVQYLRLWAAASRELQQVDDTAVSDVFRWKWTADGSYSSRGAYRALFHGTVGLPAAPLVWNSFAPLKFKFHAWLALRRRCWTADRRLRHGLPSHTLCQLCDTSDETLDHLSLHYPYARAIWAGLVARLGLPDITPTGDLGINDWWLQATVRFTKHKFELNSN
ncbi:hypothetical protein ACQ4PT_019125 [Festuca glaucescens]